MIKPTVVYELFGGKVEVFIYGKLPHNLEETDVVGIAGNLNLKCVYHPQTHTFNAKICRPADFPKKIKIDGVKIYSGCLADGVVLDFPKDAVWLRTADCPTIITQNSLTGEVIVAHAGRASLIDQENLRIGQVSRQPESVVQRICKRLLDFGRQTLLDLEVYSCCGIGAINFRHPTDHPEHGSFNGKMNHHIALTYGSDCFLDSKTGCGALDLHQLIRNQFQRCGVPADNIHSDKNQIDTARDRAEWFSRRGGDATGHNTILVIRRR